MELIDALRGIASRTLPNLGRFGPDSLPPDPHADPEGFAAWTAEAEAAWAEASAATWEDFDEAMRTVPGFAEAVQRIEARRQAGEIGGHRASGEGETGA